MKKSKTYTKGSPMLKQFGLKAFGVEITPEMLVKINRYALRELKAEEVFVRKYLMAHNAVDRDNERFPEQLLDDFSRTLPGKSFLRVHDKRSLPIGLFFDAFTEEMTKEQFKALTGEDARLPDGMAAMKVLWGWIYTLTADFNTELMANIDAGIYRHASIGFNASDIAPVKGPYDNILYWEYTPPGEALEGSIVWLGAQPGATAQKQAGEREDDIEEQKNKGGNKMEWKVLLAIFKKIFKGKSFGEDTVEDDLRTALSEHVAVEVKTATDPLTERIKALEPLEAKVKELTPLAEEGKAYRATLCEQYASAKQKLGDIGDKPEDVAKAKEIAGGFGIDFLKAELVVLGKRVADKFPSEGELNKGDDAAKKRAQGGKKVNPLVFDEEE